MFWSVMLLMAAAQPAPRAGDPAQPAEAVGGLGSLIGEDDYPAAARRADAQGIVRFRLFVGRDGRVSRCVVTGSSGNEDLDKTTCALMRARARFRPARDASGNAVEDVVNSSVGWRLVGDPPPQQGMAFEAFRHVTTLLLAGDGSIRCRMGYNDDPPVDLPEQLCREVLQGERFQASGAREEYTVVMALTPTGAAPPPGGPANYGSLEGEAEAEISLDAAGSISQCRVTLLSGRAQQASDYCEMLRADGAPQFEAADNDRPRTGRMRLSAYRRRTTTS